ncbi:MAG: hypothetical protein KDC70_08075 [Saprospiraceae bacterium]|nr:hypothetical protein [Saprospiraceae bacterium]
MDEKILRRIDGQAGVSGLSEILGERLKATDLNTLLLDVFQKKAVAASPAELLRAYRENRFVRPSNIDPLDFGNFVMGWLHAARNAGFSLLQLSPLAPLGSCAALATVHQNKVVSALRGTEVVADATNVLALESVLRREEEGFPFDPLHLCAVHRHVRAQAIPRTPGYSAHFSILGLTSAGRDTGDRIFEKESLLRHMLFYRDYLENELQLGKATLRLKPLSSKGHSDPVFRSIMTYLQENAPASPIEVADGGSRNYYECLQFKVVVAAGTNDELEIADGGFTDWTRQLSSNHKERLLISGLGLELLYKIIRHLV